jgi:hypothetical protein
VKPVGQGEAVRLTMTHCLSGKGVLVIVQPDTVVGLASGRLSL